MMCIFPQLPGRVDIGRYRNQYRLKYLESDSVWDDKVTEKKEKGENQRKLVR